MTKKEKKELSNEEMKKASGGFDVNLRGTRVYDEAQLGHKHDDVKRDPDTEEPILNRPIDISRSVQGNWTPL